MWRYILEPTRVAVGNLVGEGGLFKRFEGNEGVRHLWIGDIGSEGIEVKTTATLVRVAIDLDYVYRVFVCCLVPHHIR